VVLPQAFALALFATGAAQDVYFEQTTVTSIDGEAPGPGVVSRIWYAGRKMRMEAGGVLNGPAFILRLDLGKAYRIDPSDRTVIEINLERLRTRSALDLAMAGELMGGNEEGSARTTPLGTATGGVRTKTIAGYPCQGFRLRAGSTVMDLYVTRSIPVGIDAFTDFLEWSGASQSLGGLLAELRKLQGFPLETRARVKTLDHVHETVSTVTSVKVGPQGLTLFEPPKGFRVLAEEPIERP
jgi:hypothetical protein